MGNQTSVENADEKVAPLNKEANVIDDKGVIEIIDSDNDEDIPIKKSTESCDNKKDDRESSNIQVPNAETLVDEIREEIISLEQLDTFLGQSSSNELSRDETSLSLPSTSKNIDTALDEVERIEPQTIDVINNVAPIEIIDLSDDEEEVPKLEIELMNNELNAEKDIVTVSNVESQTNEEPKLEIIQKDTDLDITSKETDVQSEKLGSNNTHNDTVSGDLENNISEFIKIKDKNSPENDNFESFLTEENNVKESIEREINLKEEEEASNNISTKNEIQVIADKNIALNDLKTGDLDLTTVQQSEQIDIKKSELETLEIYESETLTLHDALESANKNASEYQKLDETVVCIVTGKTDLTINKESADVVNEETNNVENMVIDEIENEVQVGEQIEKPSGADVFISETDVGSHISEPMEIIDLDDDDHNETMSQQIESITDSKRKMTDIESYKNDEIPMEIDEQVNESGDNKLNNVDQSIIECQKVEENEKLVLNKNIEVETQDVESTPMKEDEKSDLDRENEIPIKSQEKYEDTSNIAATSEAEVLDSKKNVVEQSDIPIEIIELDDDDDEDEKAVSTCKPPSTSNDKEPEKKEQIPKVEDNLTDEVLPKTSPELPPQTSISQLNDDKCSFDEKYNKKARLDLDENEMRECINIDCKRDCKNFYRAPVFALNRFQINSKKKKMKRYICDTCFDNTIENYNDLCTALANEQPLITQHIPYQPDLVEISDSDSDNDNETDDSKKFDINDLITLKPDNEIFDDNDLENIITETLKNFSIDKQMKWTYESIAKRVDKNDDELEKLSLHMKELEKTANEMYYALYNKNQGRIIHELPPIDLNMEINEPAIPPFGKIDYPGILLRSKYLAPRNVIGGAWMLCEVTDYFNNYNVSTFIIYFYIK